MLSISIINSLFYLLSHIVSLVINTEGYWFFLNISAYTCHFTSSQFTHLSDHVKAELIKCFCFNHRHFASCLACLFEVVSYEQEHSYECILGISYVFILLVLVECWGIGLFVCLLMTFGLNGTAVCEHTSLLNLTLIATCCLWLMLIMSGSICVCVPMCACAHRASSTWPPCHKSINTIEVLILPPLWAIFLFKSHLAEGNLTFTDEDFDFIFNDFYDKFRQATQH